MRRWLSIITLSALIIISASFANASSTVFQVNGWDPGMTNIQSLNGSYAVAVTGSYYSASASPNGLNAYAITRINGSMAEYSSASSIISCNFDEHISVRVRFSYYIDAFAAEYDQIAVSADASYYIEPTPGTYTYDHQTLSGTYDEVFTNIQFVSIYTFARSYYSSEYGNPSHLIPGYADVNVTNLLIERVTSPVPIPGAVWLLGSGLLGLIGLKRKFLG